MFCLSTLSKQKSSYLIKNIVYILHKCTISFKQSFVNPWTGCKRKINCTYWKTCLDRFQLCNIKQNLLRQLRMLVSETNGHFVSIYRSITTFSEFGLIMITWFLTLREILPVSLPLTTKNSWRSWCSISSPRSVTLIY